ncbi:unnamed protein product, partial [Ectocarpus fasciculatus]
RKGVTRSTSVPQALLLPRKPRQRRYSISKGKPANWQPATASVVCCLQDKCRLRGWSGAMEATTQTTPATKAHRRPRGTRPTTR